MSQKLEDYEVLGVVGSGSFGTCYKVQHTISKHTFVWKAIDYGKLTEEQKKLLVSEVNLLSKLNHPNIIQYFDRILHKETTTLYIITEWCQGGDLSAIIKETKREGRLFDESFIWKALYQICRALQVCHTRLSQMTLLHRDIKPANVFIDAKRNFKLGDFGLARSEEDCIYSNNVVGTPYYMSPEIIKGRKYDRKSDIWALGCLIYEMSALFPPFRGATLQDLVNNIKVGMYPPIPECYSRNLSTVISFMLSVKREFRPTVEMILHHPLVVVNITSESRVKQTRSHESVLIRAEERQETTDIRGIDRGLKNVSLSQKEPEDISETLFKEKWLCRLESLREREAKLREKEEALAHREHSLNNKEKYLSLLERKTKDKMAFVQLYNNRKKGKQFGSTENLSDISADPGDTSICPTTAKLNPTLLPKPMFLRSLPNRKTITSKHVHFESQPLRENVRNVSSQELVLSSQAQNEHAATSRIQETMWHEQKRIQYRDSQLDFFNKENITSLKNAKSKSEKISVYHYI